MKRFLSVLMVQFCLFQSLSLAEANSNSNSNSNSNDNSRNNPSISFTGSGSTAAAPVFIDWAKEFNKKTGLNLNYQQTGSAAGIEDIKNKRVDFASSDIALSAEELNTHQLIQFPSALSGIVTVLNLPEINNVQIRLNGEILAEIFACRITRWNAPEIKAINPELQLPDYPIHVIARSDASGSTFHFSEYLRKNSTNWYKNQASAYFIDWHKDVTTVVGSSAIVEKLKNTPYSISYIDFRYALQNKLSVAQLKNEENAYISPSPVAFEAALNASNWLKNGNYEQMLTNQPGAQTWPITMGNFIIMQKNTANKERSKAVLKFFTWAFVFGDHLVNPIGLLRLPDSIQAMALKEMSQLSDINGHNLGWRASKIAPTIID